MSEKFLEVYIAALPSDGVEVCRIEHRGRRDELLEINNEQVLREKFYVWRLLEYALFVRFGKTPSALKLEREASGRWGSPYVNVSFSHTSGAVAVAVSNFAVGVDIEREVAPRVKNFAKRILTESEFLEFCDLPAENQGGHIVRLWSMKEASFKTEGKSRFVPSSVETKDGVICRDIIIGNEKLILSVASQIISELRIISVDLIAEASSVSDFKE